jgi:hypothetical protein
MQEQRDGHVEVEERQQEGVQEMGYRQRSATLLKDVTELYVISFCLAIRAILLVITGKMLPAR